MAHISECGFGYHESTGSTFNEFAEGVQTGINDNPDKFDPAKSPVSNDILVALIATMVQDYTNYQKGGKAQKQIYLTSKGFVREAVDKLVPWINGIANGDTKLIILAGFEPTYAVPAQKEPTEIAAPSAVIVETGTSTGLMSSECETYGINHFYGCIVSVGQALPATVGITLGGQLMLPANMPCAIIHDLSHNRKKKFAGLTKGVDYYFYWYVVSTGGVSQLSNAVVMTSI